MHGRFFSAGLAGLLVVLGWLAGLDAAAAQPIPPGSYLRSCRDAQVRNGRDLAAFCATRNGQWVATRLNNFPGCRSDISNQNGQLWCERRPVAPPPPPPPPRGSYLNSCRAVIVGKAGVLRAQCQRVNGTWTPAALNLANCRPGRDIANLNGRLVCN